MKFGSRLVTKSGGLLMSAVVRRWMGTLEYKCAYYDQNIDPVKPGWRGQKIYIFWHEYILFPLYLRGHNDLTMLLSQHHDADILTRIAHYMGFEFVRGSSYRGGLTAVRELVRRSRRMNLTITPDGPRGPRRKLAPGAVYLASKLGLPIVAMGLGYDRPWRLGTWDRHAVPRPCSRARAVVSPEIHVPGDLDRDGLESHRLQIERLLNRLTLEAEAWAESGTRKSCEVPLQRAAAWWKLHPIDRSRAISPSHFVRAARSLVCQKATDKH